MKKLLSLILTVCLVLCAFPICSFADVTSEGFEYRIEDGSITITGYNGYKADCIIPSSIDGRKVKKVYQNGKNDSVVNLTVPESVEELGNFAKSDNLKTIVIKNGGCSIQAGSYANCSGLQSLIIEDGGKGNGEIQKWAFADCTKLETVKFSSKTKELGEEAFKNCDSIKELTIPKTLRSLGGYCFAECGALETLNIVDQPTYFGRGCFENCTNLETVNLFEGVTSITSNPDLFFGCTGIETFKTPFGLEIDPLPASDSYGYNTFKRCSSLTYFVMSYGPKCIPQKMFTECTALSEVTIPYSVKTIHRDAFKDSDLTLIKGIRGTAAEDYANYMGIPFEEIEHIYGDLDWNERVEANDALIALRYSVGLCDLIDYHKVSGDINKDGSVTSSDALIILQHSVGIKTDYWDILGPVGKYEYNG